MRKNPDDLANQVVNMVIEECKEQIKHFNKIKRFRHRLDDNQASEEDGKHFFANYIHMRIEEKEKELYNG